MFKYAAAAVLVLVPVLWGVLMVSVLDFFEKKIYFLIQKNNKIDG